MNLKRVRPQRDGSWYEGRVILKLYLPNTTIDPAKITAVTAEMRELGPPVIRTLRVGDDTLAIEGSHRICAAKNLGLPIRLKIIPDSRELDSDSLTRHSSHLAAMLQTGYSAGLLFVDIDVIDAEARERKALNSRAMPTRGLSTRARPIRISWPH